MKHKFEEETKLQERDPSIALNGAANLILSMLSQPVREMLQETAASTLNIPLWQLVAGLVQQAYDIGLFTTPQIDPGWLQYQTSAPVIQNQARCGWKDCGKVFQPRWPKQEFCSNECGIAHQRDLAASRARKYVVGGQYPLGQEPTASPTSALHKPEEAGA